MHCNILMSINHLEVRQAQQAMRLQWIHVWPPTWNEWVALCQGWVWQQIRMKFILTVEPLQRLMGGLLSVFPVTGIAWKIVCHYPYVCLLCWLETWYAQQAESAMHPCLTSKFEWNMPTWVESVSMKCILTVEFILHPVSPVTTVVSGMP